MNDYTYVKGSRTVVRNGEWQPIDTAPKDGKLILGAYNKSRVIPIRWLIDETGEYNWWGWMNGFGITNLIAPTYWMPVSTPPPSGLDTGEKS